jgi:hypothetical protein
MLLRLLNKLKLKIKSIRLNVVALHFLSVYPFFLVVIYPHCSRASQSLPPQPARPAALCRPGVNVIKLFTAVIYEFS